MRVLCVINPSAGQDDPLFYEFLRLVGDEEAEIVLRHMGKRHPVSALVQDAKEFDRVVAVGGDGTVSSVCYQLRHTGVPVLAFPAGTANLLSLNLRLAADAGKLADALLHGAVRSFDMGELTCGGGCRTDTTRREGTKRGFLMAAGAGFDASIMASAEDLKRTVGPMAYLFGALQNLLPTVSKFDLTLDGEHESIEGIAVLVVNFARVQFDIPITRDGNPSDGLLEVAIIRARNAVELLPVVWGAVMDRTTGAHPHRSPQGLEIRHVRKVRVDASPPLSVQYDGEVLTSTTPFEVSVLPGATALVVPESYE